MILSGLSQNRIIVFHYNVHTYFLILPSLPSLVPTFFFYQLLYIEQNEEEEVLAEPEIQLIEKLPENPLLKIEDTSKQDRPVKESPVLDSIRKPEEPERRKETAEREAAAAQPKEQPKPERKLEVKEEL